MIQSLPGPVPRWSGEMNGGSAPAHALASRQRPGGFYLHAIILEGKNVWREQGADSEVSLLFLLDDFNKIRRFSKLVEILHIASTSSQLLLG